MPWWLWIVLGFALLAGEMLTPGGFFFIFFGVGAMAVGGLVWADLGGPAWFQWMLFSAVSIACLVPLRSRLLRWIGSDEPGRAVDTLVGEAAVLLDDLAPGGVGKAELRGTAWTARTGGERALRKGEHCRVERVEGLTLWVRAD